MSEPSFILQKKSSVFQRQLNGKKSAATGRHPPSTAIPLLFECASRGPEGHLKRAILFSSLGFIHRSAESGFRHYPNLNVPTFHLMDLESKRFRALCPSPYPHVAIAFVRFCVTRDQPRRPRIVVKFQRQVINALGM